METINRFFCSKIIQIWNRNYEIFPKHKFRREEEDKETLGMYYSIHALFLFQKSEK